MKINLVGYCGATTGSGIAAKRLFQALKYHAADLEVNYLTIEPTDFSLRLGTKFLKSRLKFKQSLLWKLYQLQGSTNYNAHIFNVFSHGLIDQILFNNPDAVHLHGIVGEMLSIREIAELARRVKVVWTLHDCWPFCGSEQYPLRNSRRFIDGYTATNRESVGIDFDRRLWQHKWKHWHGLDIAFIAPSRWINAELQKSKLWRGCHSVVIGNTIDTRTFTPDLRLASRGRLGIPPDGFFLGIGASNLSHPNKGGVELQQLLDFLYRRDPKHIKLLTVGTGKIRTKLPAWHLGTVDDETTLIDFYRAGDLFLSTSKYDNLPNMIMEAMACGTSVAAFDTGGIADLIIPGSGLLIPDFDVQQLGLRILEVFSQNQSCQLGRLARQAIIDNFSMTTIARKHRTFYRAIIP